ncbi:MAG: TonB-dependent receptor [Gemmatimonadetes bacterium]|nr:TonB-dependent receptor [Gemmatimonadota bacterium]
MKLAVRILSTCALAVLMMPGGARAQATGLDPKAFETRSQADTGAVLSGRVVDVDSDLPVAGAPVSIPELGRGAVSDGDGRFRLEDLPAGSYTLRVEAPGLPLHEEPFQVAAGERLTLTLTLPQGPLEVAGVTLLVDRFRLVPDPAQVPGSAHVLDTQDLQSQNLLFDDAHRVLRQVPGVNIQEEEGFGLRPNIGLRGSGSSRSAKITLMEDGVLVAPAPYAAPEAYYFPLTGRMDGIEIRKGSSQIKYGPQTTGGALNLISTRIPERFTSRFDLGGGEYETARLRAELGDSQRNFGWLAQTYQARSDGFKRVDGGGDTGFRLSDYLIKLRVNSDPDADLYNELELKLGRTSEISDETYLGLTENDFRADPFRRYAASQEDVFDSDHEQYQLRHVVRPSAGVDVTTVAYRNDFHRNWYKLDSVAGASIAAVLEHPDSLAATLDVLRGASSEAGALKVRANDRTYYGQGIQSVLGLALGAKGAQHQVEFGARYHADEEDRLQQDDRYTMLDGEMAVAERGARGSEANRINHAEAWAFFVQDRIAIGRWTFTPGVRYETIDFTRTDFGLDNPDRVRARPERLSSATPAPPSPAASTVTIRENGVNVLIPGAGASWAATSELSLFGGVHRGFAPPGPGADADTDPEESVNYELGWRFAAPAVSAELVGFINDYDNVLGRPTGVVGENGDVFNGGQVKVHGLELSADSDLGALAGVGLRLPLQLAYTYTRAEFGSSFVSDYEPWGSVLAGDELPYIPEHQGFASLGIDCARWSAGVNASFVGEMRTVAGGSERRANGRSRVAPFTSTDEALVFGLTGQYALADWSHLYVGVQNLTDREYVVARRPAGARPGLPRTLVAGIRLTP